MYDVNKQVNQEIVLIGKGKLPILGETLNQAFSSKQMSHTRRLGIKSHNQHSLFLLPISSWQSGFYSISSLY